MFFGNNNNNDEQNYYNDESYERRTDSYDSGLYDVNSSAGSAEILAKFNPYLLPGEQVYWVGKTTKGGGKGVKTGGGGANKFVGVYLIVFALIWISATLSMTSFASSFGDRAGVSGFSFMTMLFPLIGVIILIAGIVTIVGKNKDSCYAITDRRVLQITNNRFTSCEINKISNVTVNMGNNGIGTISYVAMGVPMYATQNAYNRHAPRNVAVSEYFNIPTALYSVADAQNAYRILSGLVLNNQNQIR